MKTILNIDAIGDGSISLEKLSSDIQTKLEQSNNGDNVNNLVKITYSELKSLRDNSQLAQGTLYRITDYITTTTQSETKSANHPFDVIVLALSENTLSEDAKAILHEGDTYFADSDISAWELKYCLDNDKTRFEWADEMNGKGVIYRMIDEKRNDCPYDFKNILFYNTTLTSTVVGDTTSDNYYYTFSYVINYVLYDGTTEKQVKYCYRNIMGECKVSGVLQLNKNMFRNTSFSSGCHSNTFSDNCSSNTFGNDCSSNIFGYNCDSNKFGYGCGSNKFGYGCSYNNFGDICGSNIFEDTCTSNTFGYNCGSNKFGYGCSFNKFGYGCYYNNFGDICSYNIFGTGLQNRNLDSNKTSITFNEEFYDDGSGQVVPIKYPDPSTQPNILPYKFMGQYVYEQLIPIQSLTMLGGAYCIPKAQMPHNIMVLECSYVGLGCYTTGIFRDGDLNNTEVFHHNWVVSLPYSEEYENAKYIKIVYTTMPEDGGYYYTTVLLNNSGSITMIFDSSPGEYPVSLGDRDGKYKDYEINYPGAYIPMSDIIEFGMSSWRVALSPGAAKQRLQGYGYTEQEAKNTQLNENISIFDDVWFRDKFGEDFQSKNMFLYFS